MPNPWAIIQSGNLFTYCMHNPVMWVDPSGMVIEIAGSDRTRATVLQYLQLLTNHTLQFDSNGIVSIYQWADKDFHLANNVPWLEAGNNLIVRLIRSSHVVTIRQRLHDANSFSPDSTVNMSLAGIGSGGTVYFDRHSNPLQFVFDSEGVVTTAKRPAHIGLAHELVHADRATRGVIIPLAQEGPFSFEMSRAALSPLRILGGGSTRTITHTFQLEEFAAIGIGHFTTICITENMIRREHSLPGRASHFRAD